MLNIREMSTDAVKAFAESTVFQVFSLYGTVTYLTSYKDPFLASMLSAECWHR